MTGTAASSTREDALFRRLSERSLVDRNDPGRGVRWDDDPIDLDDPRWLAGLFDPIVATSWFQDLPASERTRFAVARWCAYAGFGIEFEAALQVALLLYARRMPAGSPEVTYLQHEVIEESEHTLMFQELISRTRRVWPELPLRTDWTGSFAEHFETRLADWVSYCDEAPEQLLLAVICIEDPSDSVQRAYLRLPEEDQHPLVRQIYRLHVTDEARHLAFAKTLLTRRLKVLDRKAMNRLRYAAPAILRASCDSFLPTPRWLIEHFGIPDDALTSPAATERARQVRAAAARRLVGVARRSAILDARTTPLWGDLVDERAR